MNAKSQKPIAIDEAFSDLCRNINDSKALKEEVQKLFITVRDIEKDYQQRILELQMSVRALEIMVLSKE